MEILGMNSDYSAFIDTADEEKWNSIIQLFRDATLNQTWTYNRIRSKRCSTLIIKHKGEVVAAAMLRLFTINGLKMGFAYLGSGPMWRLKNGEDNINYLINILVALRNEYVITRNLYLRISPYIYTNTINYDKLIHIFIETGFKSCNIEERTLFLDLEPSEVDIRQNFSNSWKNNLKRAEKMGFSVRIGTDDVLFKTFKDIYKEMLARKKYPTNVKIKDYEKLQANLPKNLKPTIVICELENQPMFSVLISTIGDTAILLLGGTGNKGTKNGASFFVHWEIIKLMKKQGIQMLDLGGCNPEKNPTTYFFKAGMCGKDAIIYKRIGIMDICENPFSKIIFNSGIYIQKISTSLKKLI